MMMHTAEPVVLHSEPAAAVSGAAAAVFTSMTLLPDEGMRVRGLRAMLPGRGEIDLLHDGAFGGAFLLPFANRIRGRLTPDGTSIDTDVLGRRVRLPANWSGQEPGAERCAMHGLLLDASMRIVEQTATRVDAIFAAGDFSGHWLSQTVVRVTAHLLPTRLDLSVIAHNAGDEPLPVGIGWHPYFVLPSGERAQARVHLPARRRALVGNYDDVFPTGALEDVSGTPYDFTARDGAALGGRYFDDCFVDLMKTPDRHTVVDVHDEASGYRMRLTALSPHVKALQMYAPPDQPFVVIEPQFNVADPFSRVWPDGFDTGMQIVPPSESVTWAARCELMRTAG